MNKEIEDGKACAALSYILVGIIWYFADAKMKKNNYVKFHVKQGLALLILSVVVQVVGSLIPIIGWFIILPVGNVIVLVLFIIGLINAVNGKKKELPLIGSFSNIFKF